MNLQTYLSRAAHAYDRLEHTPWSQPVTGAYRCLQTELWRQFCNLSMVLDIVFVALDPYAGSRDMFEDISRYSRLLVFTGFQPPCSHPLADFAPNGQTYNSVFRAVHDGLAHYPNRYSFGYRGEFNAFKAHARLLSKSAIHAIATETLGQNAWFNFGPHGDVPAKDRPFASHKASLLPWSLICEAWEVT